MSTNRQQEGNDAFRRLISVRRQIESLKEEIESKGKDTTREIRLQDLEQRKEEIWNKLLDQNKTTWRKFEDKLYAGFPQEQVLEYLERSADVWPYEKFSKTFSILRDHYARARLYPTIRKRAEILYTHSKKLDDYARQLYWLADKLEELKPVLIEITPPAYYYADGSMRFRFDDGFHPKEEPKAELIRNEKFWVEAWKIKVLADSMRLLKKDIKQKGLLGKGKRAPQYPIEHSCVVRLKSLLKPSHIAGIMDIVFPSQAPWTVERIKKIKGKTHPTPT